VTRKAPLFSWSIWEFYGLCTAVFLSWHLAACISAGGNWRDPFTGLMALKALTGDPGGLATKPTWTTALIALGASGTYLAVWIGVRVLVDRRRGSDHSRAGAAKAGQLGVDRDARIFDTLSGERPGADGAVECIQAVPGGASFPGVHGNVTLSWPLMELHASDTGVWIVGRWRWVRQVTVGLANQGSATCRPIPGGFWSISWGELRRVEYVRRAVFRLVRDENDICEFRAVPARRGAEFRKQVATHHIPVERRHLSPVRNRRSTG
jgi:hypothetical protein